MSEWEEARAREAEEYDRVARHWPLDEALTQYRLYPEQQRWVRRLPADRPKGEDERG